MDVTFKDSDETLLAELMRLEAELFAVGVALDQIEEGLRRALRGPRAVKSEVDAEAE